MPNAFKLEMSHGAEAVHGGREIKKVMRRLGKHYKLHKKVLHVDDYGDPTNRKRLFIVGILKKWYDEMMAQVSVAGVSVGELGECERMKAWRV